MENKYQTIYDKINTSNTKKNFYYPKKKINNKYIIKENIILFGKCEVKEKLLLLSFER